MEHSEAKANMENYDVKAAFNESYEEARARFGKRPNILVCGYTGSGKSSLIRAILGDIVPQDAIGVGKPRTTGYDHYQNDLISIYDSKGLELGETEEAFITKPDALSANAGTTPMSTTTSTGLVPSRSGAA